MKKLLVTLVICCLSGCIPTTSATIEIGTGYALADMDRAEKLIEDAKFVRIWSEPPKGVRAPRFDYKDEIFSIFESVAPGFGAGVHLQKKDGLLTIGFTERNTSFSERGRQILQQLLNAARVEYGENVVIKDN